jgi:predicted DNA-binding transcriptional regulator YafY
MLAHQLPVCPPFSEFWRELPEIFSWLQSETEQIALPSIGATVAAPAGGLDETWHMPAMVTRWGYTTPLEAIRFAAANRLLVDLDYENEQSERGTRSIEPYALRRTRMGELLLYAVGAGDGGARSYRVDRILGARVTQHSFQPRFAIELTAGDPVTVPSVSAPSTRPRLPPTSISAHPARARRVAPGRLAARTGVTYVFECPLCQKRFNRKTMDANLNPHKSKQGWPCSGRGGIYRETKY